MNKIYVKTNQLGWNRIGRVVIETVELVEGPELEWYSVVGAPEDDEFWVSLEDVVYPSQEAAVQGHKALVTKWTNLVKDRP